MLGAIEGESSKTLRKVNRRRREGVSIEPVTMEGFCPEWDGKAEFTFELLCGCTWTWRERMKTIIPCPKCVGSGEIRVSDIPSTWQDWPFPMKQIRAETGGIIVTCPSCGGSGTQETP